MSLYHDLRSPILLITKRVEPTNYYHGVMRVELRSSYGDHSPIYEVLGIAS